jgi:predicted transporter
VIMTTRRPWIAKWWTNPFREVLFADRSVLAVNYSNSPHREIMYIEENYFILIQNIYFIAPTSSMNSAGKLMILLVLSRLHIVFSLIIVLCFSFLFCSDI